MEIPLLLSNLSLNMYLNKGFRVCFKRLLKSMGLYYYLLEALKLIHKKQKQVQSIKLQHSTINLSLTHICLLHEHWSQERCKSQRSLTVWMIHKQIRKTFLNRSNRQCRLGHSLSLRFHYFQFPLFLNNMCLLLKWLAVSQNVASGKTAAGKVKKKTQKTKQNQKKGWRQGFGILASEVMLKLTD